MNGADRGSEPEWPVRRGPNGAETNMTVVDRGGRRISPVFIALGVLLLLLLGLWLFTTTRNEDQDKLINPSTETSSASDPDKLCSKKATYDLIKRELFRRAAQVRGSDQAAFDRLSSYATLRMENPVMESEDSGTGAVNCSGSLSLDLPLGVAVVGGRRTVSAEVDYSVQQATDDSGPVVLLRNADPIITPLATLARIAEPAAQPASPDANVVSPADPLAPQPEAQPAAPMAPRSEPRAVNTRPSFDCGNAGTRGEIAVCSDAGLATLDRQMAAQFNRALGIAGPNERSILQRTRSRFLSYRDSCQTNGCIADAYRGRMREISDIMSGRWQPPR
ncbi:lysozyme inhibitor LprI family protein [Sphingomonas hankyongi]|uniref:Lysozyme inhibitor LprI N-terminal domain-containing protein n=1 Tax=Sphingomonas hankyongi TaxID=2908209 RepID=A0ABT0S4M6_9SPHN|nr:hypothetical protein [Sphingomonas hankyongi]MCL6730520.1 hypothetical protein [Sphingomonas hankyongi]